MRIVYICCMDCSYIVPTLAHAPCRTSASSSQCVLRRSTLPLRSLRPSISMLLSKRSRDYPPPLPRRVVTCRSMSSTDSPGSFSSAITHAASSTRICPPHPATEFRTRTVTGREDAECRTTGGQEGHRRQSSAVLVARIRLAMGSNVCHEKRVEPTQSKTLLFDAMRTQC